MARKPTSPTKTITLIYPRSTKRFRCWYDYGTSPKSHLMKDGTTAHICGHTLNNRIYSKRCFSYVCEEHWQEHEDWHTLQALSF